MLQLLLKTLRQGSGVFNGTRVAIRNNKECKLILCSVAKVTDEQYTTVIQSTAGRFDPRVFVNATMSLYSIDIVFCFVQLRKAQFGSKCIANLETVQHVLYALKNAPPCYCVPFGKGLERPLGHSNEAHLFPHTCKLHNACRHSHLIDMYTITIYSSPLPTLSLHTYKPIESGQWGNLYNMQIVGALKAGICAHVDTLLLLSNMEELCMGPHRHTIAIVQCGGVVHGPT